MMVCRSPYQVLDGYNQDDGSNVGIDIDIIDRKAGHRRSVSDIWEFVENLSASRSISFGQSVASKPYGRNDITV